MAATGILRITDTFKYIPKTFNSPNTTIEYYLQQEIADIILILRDPLNTLPFLYYGDASKNTINRIAHILQRSTDHHRL